MAYREVHREVHRMEIPEIIRRWPAGVGPQEIASGTGLSRNTVRKYPCFRRAGSGGGKGGRHRPEPDRLWPLRAYPNNPAALSAMRVQAK